MSTPGDHSDPIQKKQAVHELLRRALDHGLPVPDRWAAFSDVIRDREVSTTDKTQIVNLLLRDVESQLRLAAAMKAGSVADEDTVSLLWRLSEVDEDEDVRRNALASMVEVIGEAAIPILIRRINSDDELVRTGAFTQLSLIPGDVALQEMLKVLTTHSEKTLQLLAALRLADRGREEGEHLLIEHMDDEPPCGLACVRALYKLNRMVGWQKLQEALSHLEELGDPTRRVVLHHLRVDLNLSETNEESILAHARAIVAKNIQEGQ